jgi:hypothetical protein
MVAVREPILHTIPIVDLRPTQITVGMREVTAKQKRWQQIDKKKRSDFLGKHMIPVIRGPKDRLYVIDHHHLSLALHNEGEKNVAVAAIADLRALSKDEFWVHMDNRSWVHPYDAAGRRKDYDDLPNSVTGMKDDPFRSVAGELRRMGGFAKDTTPFSEFLWADFMRRRMDKTLVENDFAGAMVEALRLAKSKESIYLPGWCGPHDDN